MPTKEHRKLAAAARKRGLKPGSERYNAYVYGTLHKIKGRRQRKRRH